MKLLPTRSASTRLQWALILFAAVFLALFLGAASPLLPHFIVGALIGLLILLPVYLLRPAWLMVPTILFQLYFPSQPAADVVTVLLIGRAAVTLAQRWSEIRPLLANALIKPLAVLGVCVLVSFAAAVTVLHVGKSPAYQDARIYVYWLWIIPFVAWVPRDRPARWFAMNLLLVAVLVAVLAILQGALGINLAFTGRVGQLDTLGNISTDITRVQIPGFVFVMFGICFSVAQLIREGDDGFRWIYLPLLALFALAEIYNFGRALWFWTVFGVALTALTMGWKASVKTFFLVSIISVLLGTSIVMLKPELADTMAERVSSVLKEGGRSTSYGWREAENSNARAVLARTFLLGAGMGGDYRRPVIGLVAFENHTRYIHNGHLSVLLKLSIFGYLAYVALFSITIKKAASLRQDPAFATFSASIVGWALAFIGQNITQPDIMTAHGLTLFASVISFLMVAEAKKQGALAEKRDRKVMPTAVKRRNYRLLSPMTKQ